MHHEDVFCPASGQESQTIPGLVNVVVPLVVEAVTHRRSAIQSTGLRCFQELFR